MAEGLGSLANGFLAGFQTMNNYQRGKKADERADQQFGLAQAQDLRAAKLQDFNINNTIERNKVSDTQWGEEFAHKVESSDRSHDISIQTLGLQQQREARLAAAASAEQDHQAKLRWQEEHAPAMGAIYSKLEQGEDISDSELAIISNPNAGKYHVGLYAGDALQAGKTVLKEISDITQLGASGELNNMTPEAVHKRINSPEITKAMKTIANSDASKIVGKLDPETGKLITGAEFSSFTPLPENEGGEPGFAISLNVTYDDGTTTTKPVTEGRSTSPDDPVKRFTVPTLANYAGQHTHLSQAVARSNVSQRLGMVEGPDTKGHRSSVTSLMKEQTKQLASVDKMLASGKINDEQAQNMRQLINDTFQQPIESLGGLYNTSSKAAPTPDAETRAWLAGDPQKLEFIQDMDKSGALQGVMSNPERRDNLYLSYQKEAGLRKAEDMAAQRRLKALGGQAQPGAAPATTGSANAMPTDLRGAW